MVHTIASEFMITVVPIFAPVLEAMQNQESARSDVRACECEDMNEDEDTLSDIASNQVWDSIYV